MNLRFHTPAALTFVVAVVSILLASTLDAGELPVVAPEKVGLSRERLAHLSSAMQAEVNAKRKAGIVTLIARNGRIAHLQAFGMADVEAGRKMQTDAYFRLYSMTKPVTSVALLILYEEGRFQLSDPLDKYLPSFANMKVFSGEADGKMQFVDAKRKITIHDIFRHTAGLLYGFGSTPVDNAYRAAGINIDSLASLQELTDKLASQPLAYQPGERYVYSYAHDVQARLVEVLSGMKFDEFVSARITGPLGMKDTFFGVPSDRASRYTTSYVLDDRDNLLAVDTGRTESGRPGTAYKHFTKIPFGGHGLSSSITDYAKFAQMLVNGGTLDGVRILGRKTVELMTSDNLPSGVPGPAPGRGYGLGVGVVTSPAERANLASTGQFGWSGAATTLVIMDPKEKLVALVFSQRLPHDSEFTSKFETLVYQALVE